MSKNTSPPHPPAPGAGSGAPGPGRPERGPGRDDVAGGGPMGPATRAALEIDAVLELLGGFAATDLGEDQVTSLAPLGGPHRDHERQCIDEIARLHEDAGALVRPRDLPWRDAVERLGGRRGLDPGHILALATLLEDFDRTRRRIDVHSPGLLADLREALVEGLEGGDAEERRDDAVAAALEAAAGLARQVRSVLDERGAVRSDATPELASLVSSVRSSRDRLYRSFESYAREHGDVLGDDTVTRAEGRLAVLLPAGHRGRLQGIVHGRSGTEKSYYFEPLELVEDNNRLQEQLAREEEERARILAELARAFAAHAPLIRRLSGFLAVVDRRQAAHRFARTVEATFTVMATEDVWSLTGAVHPLLDPRLRGLREERLGSPGHRGDVVPLDLDADGDRVLVITGPNAGGKTVALKTLGVLSFLAACGWPVPASSGSSLPEVQRWIAVVGDEQDVLAERSTFSAHLERLREVWHLAAPATLVLLDEIASGTNPEEGSALAIALLERLVSSGCHAVLTTHLLQLANAALALDGCASLAMEFDAASGRPTYAIRAGAPGSSHALELARRLDLPEQWLERAEALLGEEQMTLRHLIAETEASRHRAGELEQRTREELAEQETLRRRLERELEDAREERRGARERVKRELETFRRSAREELSREVARSRAKAGEDGASPRTAPREAARRVARIVADSGLEEAVGGPEERHAGRAAEVGDTVRHRALGWTGTLDRLNGDRAEVSVRGKRFSCRLGELSVAPSTSGGGRKRPTVTVDASRDDLGMELVLVGERVARALDRLDAYLDQAVVAGLERARVVHGFGTGRLKEAVREHLRSHPHVASFEAAPQNQGGEGATVVLLR